MIATIETSSKTAAQIKQDYKSIIDSFGIETKIKTITSDSAASNKSVFEYRSDIKWYPCTGHNLNLVFKHAFTFDQSDKD